MYMQTRFEWMRFNNGNIKVMNVKNVVKWFGLY